MSINVRQNVILSAAMIIGSAVLWIASSGLRPESALFPRLLLAIITCCALVIAGEQVVKLRRMRQIAPTVNADGDVRVAEAGNGSAQNEGAGPHGTARQWLIAAALVVYVVAFVYVGPYTATFLLLAGLYVLLSRDRTWKRAVYGALLAAALTVLLYGLFSLGLNVSMPAGLLF